MIAIDEMPDHARIWVYQADRPFSEKERVLIDRSFEAFTGQWAAHGNKLMATYGIQHNQFIVLAVDESYNQASGCSIDASVQVIRQIEQHTGLSLLDRTKVAFLEEGKVRIKPFNQLKAAVEAGEIRRETTVFNNTVQNASEWRTQWAVPAQASWLSRYFS